MKKLLLMILTFCTLNSSAQNIAVNTDLVMDVLSAPSLGVEMTMTKRSTLGLNMAYSPKMLYRKGHALVVQPEWRFYFSGRPMYRHFVGLGAMWTDYNFDLHGKHYEGNASGVGITFGYVWNIKNRWSIDFHSGLGAAFYKQKTWEYKNFDKVAAELQATGTIAPNEHGTVFIPVRAGISISYVLK